MPHDPYDPVEMLHGPWQRALPAEAGVRSPVFSPGRRVVAACSLGADADVEMLDALMAAPVARDFGLQTVEELREAAQRMIAIATCWRAAMDD